MSATETAILAIVGKLPGHNAMRELHPRHPAFAKGKFAIVDVGRWDSPILAQGPTWEDVLAHLTNLKVHGPRCELLSASDSALCAGLVCSCPFGRHP